MSSGISDSSNRKRMLDKPDETKGVSIEDVESPSAVRGELDLVTSESVKRSETTHIGFLRLTVSGNATCAILHRKPLNGKHLRLRVVKSAEVGTCRSKW